MRTCCVATTNGNEAPEFMSTTHDSPALFPAPGEVCFLRLLPGPIERVWEFLTDPEKRGRWLASGPMELRVGGKVSLQFHHATLTPQPVPEPVPEKYQAMITDRGEACDFTGTVTRCEPPHVLAYTWGESKGSRSEVTFKLTPEGRQVWLALTHHRLGDDPSQLAGVASGWHTHLAILGAKLAGETPPPFWATQSRHEATYAAQLATLSTAATGVAR